MPDVDIDNFDFGSAGAFFTTSLLLSSFRPIPLESVVISYRLRMDVWNVVKEKILPGSVVPGSRAEVVSL